MQNTCLKLMLLMAMAIVFNAPSGWAKEKGYCYIVSYSLSQKTAYITPVLVATVSGATFSEEEFVADVVLIRKMEDQFNQYLAVQGISSTDLVTSARVAYRSRAIADKRLADEKRNFTGRGYAIKTTDQFKFKN